MSFPQCTQFLSISKEIGQYLWYWREKMVMIYILMNKNTVGGGVAGWRKRNKAECMNGLFIGQLFQHPGYFILYVVWVILSICIHEWCHAYTALRLGDDTAKRLGFLTMNPLVVMGWPSLVMLMICGLAFGRVPVNGGLLRRRWHSALVSLAGPLGNLLLMLMGLLLLRLGKACGLPGMILGVLYMFANLNALLFVFNMLPVPPLDGWGIVTGLFPRLGACLSTEVRNAMILVMFMLLMVPPVWRVVDWLAENLLVLGIRLFWRQ